jgi:Ca2+:H+ antiporter
VLGVAVLAGGDSELDRRSSVLQLALVLGAVAAFLIPSVPSWNGGDPERHGLYLATLGISAALLVVYLGATAMNLRRHREAHDAEPAKGAWALWVALVVLGVATVATALVSELMVHSLEAFGEALGLSDFFVAAVVVAIVGNAAEHGSAVVVAHRGNMRLAAEIAMSSAAQVAVFVAPAAALLSWIVGPGLPLSFRYIELGTMALAAGAVCLVVADGRTRRWEGVGILGLYAAVVASYWIVGDG